MATDQRTLPAFFNTNTDFQTWCQGIHAQLVAAGWTQTADTGQINNTTVTKPGGSNTSMGYEIWRNAVSDIFFKIEYGSGGSASTPSIWLTPGTGSNGSGTITGPASSTLNRTQLGSSNQSRIAGDTLPSYCSGDGTYLAIVSNVDTTYTASNASQAWGFAIDKLRDASGAVTGEGFFIVGWNGADSSNRWWSVIGNAPLGNNAANTSSIFHGTTQNVNNALGAGGGLRSYNGNELVVPPMIAAGQLRFLKALLIYNVDEFGISNGSTFTATNLGASHTYLTMPIISYYGQKLGSTNRAPSYNFSDCWAILWE